MKTVKKTRLRIKASAVPKKNMRKHVYWKDNGDGVLVYLVGYCPDTLSYFNGLFLDARKSVSGLDASTAICGKVKKSDSVQGFTLMLIDVAGPKREIEGFKECEWRDLRIESF
jgi:hypothetical protein